MRSLCVAEAYPWPPKDGYRLRLSNMIAALTSLGPVDLLCLDGSDAERGAPPAGVTVIDAPESPESRPVTWAPSWLVSSEPRRLVRRNFDVARRVLHTRHVHGDLSERPDLAFYSHVDSWSRTWDLIDAPSILDFDNLENLLTRSVRELGPVVGPDPSPVERAAAAARYAVASACNLVDEARWDETQRRAANCVDRVLVCSDLDVARSGCSNAVVVPNGYELPWEPADHTAVIDPERPVFGFIGLLSYAPNTDAVQWFATEVFPRIRDRHPGAVFRIVGRGAEAVEHLASLPGVEVPGAVDSLEPELRATDVSVVPIRSGAGTRLKVIEAMANRIPMVSTTLGCEGIDAVDGVHLLIADAAESFAEQCARLVDDDRLRAELIAAAELRFVERYRWSEIRDRVAALALEVAGVRADASAISRLVD